VDDGVGKKLHEARTRKKLSLQEVEEATKIRGRYLGAIESDDWDQLPGDTYARAFIRTYGRFLGLDGDRLAEEHRRSRGTARPGERLPRVDPKPRPVVRERRFGRRGISPRALAVGVTTLVIAALLAVGLATDGGSDGDETGTGKASQQRPQPRPHVGQAVPLR